MMQKVDVSNGSALRDVALDLQKRFCPELQHQRQAGKPTEKKDTKPADSKPSPAIVNPPLDFELKGLDQAHPYLLGRGFSKETIAHFGLGFCSRGLLKERIVIPLHNHKSQLIGYAGRVVDDGLVSEENPRYRFPSKRERDGKTFEFRKTLFLYNGFRITGPVDDLIVVEGFPSVWWLHQNGLSRVVATMGSDCSERQAELIVSLVKPKGHVWFLPDGDEAGKRFAESLLLQISPYRFMRWVKLEEGRQPTDLGKADLDERLYL
jgi:DNA primase